MEAFKVRKKGKILDYRVGKNIDLSQVKEFFTKKYVVERLWQEKRHVVGWVEREAKEFFLKLSTTEGIGTRSETEKVWNQEFNRYSANPRFKIPQNLEDGYFGDLYFLVMERIDGSFVCDLAGKNNLIEQNIDRIIDLAEHIQNLPLNIPINDAIQNSSHQEWFKLKTKSWLDSIPEEVAQRYGLAKLWKIVVDGAENLSEKPRHGDFAPWHIIVLSEGRLGLIDGEHSHSHGVENYDICYFIQRVHTVLKMPSLAIKIFNQFIERGYNKEKLQVVLASRAIGGFLDQSFNPNPNYDRESEFKNWVSQTH